MDSRVENLAAFLVEQRQNNAEVAAAADAIARHVETITDGLDKETFRAALERRAVGALNRPGNKQNHVRQLLQNGSALSARMDAALQRVNREFAEELVREG